MDKINKVLIVGGTHGNELTGVFLVKKFQKLKNIFANYSFKVDFLIANQEAIKQGKRYLDKDLNRCFSSAVLTDESLQGIELDLAHKLVDQLGNKGECKYDFIIDLHTSTANMGVNLVLTKHDKFHLTMVAEVKTKRDDVTITSEAKLLPDHHFLCALADHRVIVEVGPVAQNLLQAQAIEKTEQATLQILDFVQQWNDQTFTEYKNVDILEYFGKLYFPVDAEQNICAYIHKNVQGQDYQSLKNGDPLFVDIEGNTINYDGPDCLVSFVNEAAYYDQKIAMCQLLPTTKVIP